MPAYLAERISGELDGAQADLVVLERFKLDGSTFAIVVKGKDFDEAIVAKTVPTVYTMRVTTNGLDGLTYQEELDLLDAAAERGEHEKPDVHLLDPGDGRGERAFEEILVDQIVPEGDEQEAWLAVLFDLTDDSVFQTLIKDIQKDGTITFRPPDDDDPVFDQLSAQAKALRDMLQRSHRAV
jgi:hypothetical protein